jgi:hypothetical protein
MPGDGPKARSRLTRGPLAFLTLILLAAACTEAGDPRGPARPRATPRPATPAATPFLLRVVATLSGPDAAEDATYVDGIRLGQRVVDRRGRVMGRPVDVEMADDGGIEADTIRLVREAVLAPGTSAVLVVGPGDTVTEARLEIEKSRTPVFLLGGDLYSSMGLFRQVFQTSVPLRWQAATMARYLVQDRAHREVAFVTDEGPGTGGPRGPAAEAEEAFGSAMAEEGREYRRVSLPPGFSPRDVIRPLEDVDAAAYFGSPTGWRRLVRGLEGDRDPPQLATWADGLGPMFASGVGPPPGTVAPYAYTWAGWAEPIRRVAAFRDLCQRVLGHPPQGFEQEGFDAVRLLGDALQRSRGRGGDALVGALESFTDARFSSLPIRLGPDDHLFLVDRHVGVFAVEGPGRAAEPWVPSWAPWRPVMRTFTSNGERTIIPDLDRDVFFPGWRPREPAPDFWTSRYGITSRRGDPLH